MVKVNDKNLCERCFSNVEEINSSCPICGYSSGQDVQYPTALPIGTVLLGQYLVGKVLGKGGFGVTYLAYDIKNDKKVALKEYFPDTLAHRNTGETLISTFSDNTKESYEMGAKKFYEEARTITRFNGHPNIINVQVFFYENSTAYFVMEYVEGVDLKRFTAQNGGRLKEQELLKIILPVMDALIVVHSVGVLHRDISPDNIYITNDGDVKLLDFGASRQVFGEQSKSLSVVLKQGFAPFEQYQTHGKQGPWSDVYALAATMYYCLTGQVPEPALDRVVEDNLKRPSQLAMDISPQLEGALIKALSISSSSRYQSIVELKNAINFEKIENDLTQQKKDDYIEKTQDRTDVKLDEINKSKSSAEKVSFFTLIANLPKVTKLVSAIMGIIILAAASIILYGVFDNKNNNAIESLCTQNISNNQTVENVSDQAEEPKQKSTSSNSSNIGQENVQISSAKTQEATQTPGNSTNIVDTKLLSDEVVIDKSAGLMWMKKDFSVIEGRFTKNWNEAMNWAKKMNTQKYAGYSDWNVASIKEYRKINRKTYSTVFEEKECDYFWSRNEISNYVASYIDFHGGAAVSGDKSGGNNGITGEPFHFSVRLSRLISNTEEQNTVSDLSKTSEWIYYTNYSDNSKLYKILSDGTENQKVSDEEMYSKSYENGWIYYRNRSDKLCRMSVNGDNIEQIGNDTVGYVSVLNGWIYYSNWSDDRKLYKMRIDGTKKQKLGNVRAYDVVASGDWIYYRNEDKDNKLYKINITGNENKSVVEDGTYGLTVNNGWIYYINESDFNNIYKVTIDGKNKQKIRDDSATFISSFGDWVYYNGDSMYKMKTDGTDTQKLCSDYAKFLCYIVNTAD